MNNIYKSQFNFSTDLLIFDINKSILLCINKNNNKKRWIKKIDSSFFITNIIDGNENYYISMEANDINGEFVAINKKNGETIWQIPGKSYFQIFFDSGLYIIFVDESNQYFLLKVNTENGNKIWYRTVNIDLLEYSFKKDIITFNYSSGKIEKISPENGHLIS